MVFFLLLWEEIRIIIIIIIIIIIVIIIYSLEFFRSVLADSLGDSKSSQVTRILLSILTFLNNAIIWMVSTRPPTAKSSSLLLLLLLLLLEKLTKI